MTLNQILMLMVLAWAVVSCNRHVIRTGKAWIDLGTVTQQHTNCDSPENCKELCSNTKGCGGSMFLSGPAMCLTYPWLCACPPDAIRLYSNTTSCYKVVEQPRQVSGNGWQTARDDCKHRGMHLLAINTETEQRYIQTILSEYGPDCKYTYSSGWSGDGEIWQWNVTAYHSQLVNYSNWEEGQPDNNTIKNPAGQDVIGILNTKNYNYTWGDLARNHGPDNVFCHVCECTAPDCD